ncbi:MAG: hypothetical protein HYS13_25150 [Planctomycetia bacterium]|nr:hypothetical protein [Planctomycetia bacterium]
MPERMEAAPEELPIGPAIEAGEVVHEDVDYDVDYWGEGHHRGWDDGCCDDCDDGWHDDCCEPCRLCFCAPDNLSLFAGAHGFKGPVDFPPPGADSNGGNFGFHEGLNLGIPIDECCGIAGQIGAQFYHSNFSGTAFDAAGETEDRGQVFVTAGVFRRSSCGWQGGVAWDYMHDDYYVTTEFNQVRIEGSYVCPNGRELGAFAAVSDDAQTMILNNQFVEEWEPNDYYCLFFRQSHECGGNFRIFGGATENGDGLLGGDFLVPLTNCWAMTGAIHYLIPEETGDNTDAQRRAGVAGFQQEAWSIGINLTYITGGVRRCGHGCGDKYMPLFNVADNGWMLIDRGPLGN